MELRVAKHTNDLEKIKSFYMNILGFELLGHFENHSNYDGIFLGKKDLNWHLEFTKSNEIISFNNNEDDIFVFYSKTIYKYNLLVNNILNNNIAIITSKNPYWNSNGKMIQDPDGNRIVISNLKAI